MQLELIKALAHTTEKNVLEQVRKVLIANGIIKESNNIAGYQPDGEPFTFEQLKKRIKASEDAIERGEVISMEDLVKASENW